MLWWMPELLIILTIVINLNNWSYYYIKILEIKQSNNNKLGVVGEKYKMITRIVNGVTLVVILVFLGLSSYYLHQLYNDS